MNVFKANSAFSQTNTQKTLLNAVCRILVYCIKIYNFCTHYRTVFLRLASLAVLIATIYRIVSCTDKETTCNVGQNACDSLRVSV